MTVLFCAFFSGLLLGRLAYLMFRDLRLGFTWLFGTVDDSRADQVRLLTFSSAATIAAAVLALNNGVNVIAPVIITPFLFNWSAEVILMLHRAFGATFENAVLQLHPVDIGYDLFKRLMTMMWSQALSGRGRNGDMEAPAPRTDDSADRSEEA
jgi:hypothetical protein